MIENFDRRFLTLDVQETSEGRGFWLDKPWINDSRRAALVSAPILAVPTLGKDGVPVFPDGTSEFIGRLQALLGDEIELGIAINDESYEEIALHSKSWRIPTLVLTAFIWPVVTNIFSNRLDEVLPGHTQGDMAEVTVIVEGPSHKSVKVTFKGAPEEIGQFLEKAVPKYIAALEGDSSETTSPAPENAPHHRGKGDAQGSRR
jgi:hypothetical protein